MLRLFVRNNDQLEVAACDLGRNPLAEACGHCLADASSADDTC